MVSERALRSVSACALPRPSAMASAKLANSTVNHSHSVICRLNLKSAPPRNSITVVMTLPISTTNMTGLPIILRGFSLSSASSSGAAARSSIPRLLSCLAMPEPQKVFPAPISRCSRIGPRLKAGKNVSAPTMMMTPISKTVNNGVVTGKRPQRRRNILLLRQVAGNRQHGDDHQEAAHQHGDAAGDVVPGRVAVQSAEGRAVVGRLRGECIDNLAEAVRAGIQRCWKCRIRRRKKSRRR